MSQNFQTSKSYNVWVQSKNASMEKHSGSYVELESWGEIRVQVGNQRIKIPENTISRVEIDKDHNGGLVKVVSDGHLIQWEYVKDYLDSFDKWATSNKKLYRKEQYPGLIVHER